MAEAMGWVASPFQGRRSLAGRDGRHHVDQRGIAGILRDDEDDLVGRAAGRGVRNRRLVEAPHAEKYARYSYKTC